MPTPCRQSALQSYRHTFFVTAKNRKRFLHPFPRDLAVAGQPSGVWPGWRLSLPGKMQPRFRGSGSVGPGVKTVGAGQWAWRWVGLVRCGAIHSARHTLFVTAKNRLRFLHPFPRAPAVGLPLGRGSVGGGFSVFWLLFCFLGRDIKQNPPGQLG